jgi:dipeptidyl aminopeptidase/acylaminoacyl peptidase
MKRLIIAAGAAAFVLGSAAFPQDAPEPPERSETLQLEHYWNWETAGGPQISPDGETLIYTRRRVDGLSDSIASELWVMDTDGGRHRFLTEGGGVQWSPSGDRIAFLRGTEAGAQIFVRWMDAEGATSQITHTRNRIKSFQWSPDGSRIAFMAETPLTPAIEITIPGAPRGADLTESPMVTDRLNYRVDRQGLKTGYDHFFVVPADGGTERQLTAGEWDARSLFSGIPSGGWDWTPDGEALVFDGDLSPEVTDPSYLSGIHRVEIASGEITTLFDDGGNWSSPVVSPDGDLIAFVGHAASPVNYPALSIQVMNADGSDVRTLRADLPDSPSTLFWDERGRALTYGLNFEGSTNLRRLDLRGRESEVTQGVHRFSLSSLGENGSAAGVLSSPTNTGNVAVADSRGRIEVLTDLNADILDGVTLGRTEEIWYDSYDGTRVQGWIVYPPDFDPNEQYPLILSIHGGPHAMYGVNFNFRFQQWASDGYIVLYTNPRGSTGYTPEFANAIDNAYPGRADYEDLMSGVDALIERGYVDEDNLFATGCSGGGVLTTWIVTQTDRFAAAAALCPVTNWISFTGQADISAWSFERFRPHYWEDPDLWLRHSPIMHAHQVTTPTLLMTGAEDLRTPLAQAEEFYANLRRRGVPSVLISMVGEYHGTTSIPSNLLRTQLYLDAWFKEHGTFDDEATRDEAEDSDGDGGDG